jgi:hypothetical protein
MKHYFVKFMGNLLCYFVIDMYKYEKTIVSLLRCNFEVKQHEKIFETIYMQKKIENISETC